MPRGPIIILLIVAAIGAGVFFAFQAIRKNNLFGNSLQVRVKILSAEDDQNAKRGEETIPKTVLEMDIFFPMGNAPEKYTDLTVADDNNQDLEVIWAIPEKEDLPEQALTRWRFKEAFFPFGFRQGTLREKSKDLTYFKVPQVPFNVAPAPQNQ